MDLKNITFVALDLETTGLSPEKDTIIEVAAVKFHLERDGEVFRMTHVEERSMLIDPGRDIDEHISMITGISDQMVIGKPRWGEVRDRVRAFIDEDSIIVGHNVLFDVAMFGSHGIDLSSHRILDTFELSELFSPEAESLNLGFLGKHIGIDMESEHRALDDTRLSARLFLHYLSLIARMYDADRQLWRYARSRDESRAIDTLLMIVSDDRENSHLDASLLGQEEEEMRRSPSKKENTHAPYETFDLSSDWEEERAIIDAAVKKGKVLLFSSSKKQSSWLEKKLSFYKVAHHIERSEYISLRVFHALIMRPIWSRKETILLLRLMKWLESTETGRIDELKWYGEEVSYKDILRSGRDEYSRFHRQNEETKKAAEIILAESYSPDSRREITNNHTTLIVRDIIDLDSALRYRDSVTIHWRDMYGYVGKISHIEDEDRMTMYTALSLIEEIVRGTVARPTGPSISPPGDYGETYFYRQQDLWHRGHIWLIWADEQLERSVRSLREKSRDLDVLEEKHLSLFESSMRALSRLIHIGDTNLGLILQVKNDETSLSIIPREMKREISSFLSTHAGEDTIITGYNIGTTYLREYLADFCGVMLNRPKRLSSPKVEISGPRIPSILPGKTVFLGTNLKHLRALREEIRKMSDYPIYTQGVSGGRGKMRTLFEKDSDAVLLGLIDTWKDDSLFWEGVDTLYITKVPFDPPTDPYYLSRTAGMSNNFENYSLPIAIHTISTLIGRVHGANSEARIVILDEKLMTMTWGHSLREALKI